MGDELGDAPHGRLLVRQILEVTPGPRGGDDGPGELGEVRESRLHARRQRAVPGHDDEGPPQRVVDAHGCGRAAREPEAVGHLRPPPRHAAQVVGPGGPAGPPDPPGGAVTGARRAHTHREVLRCARERLDHGGPVGLELEDHAEVHGRQPRGLASEGVEHLGDRRLARRELGQSAQGRLLLGQVAQRAPRLRPRDGRGHDLGELGQAAPRSLRAGARRRTSPPAAPTAGPR